MSRLKCIMGIMLVSILCGCGSVVDTSRKTEVKSFSKDRLMIFDESVGAPRKIDITDGIWNIQWGDSHLNGNWIAVGEDIENRHIIYRDKDVTASAISASDRCIAWVERNVGEARNEVHYRVYDKDTEKLKDFFVLTVDGSNKDYTKGLRCWVYEDDIYYYVMNYETGDVEYFRYSLSDGETTLLSKERVPYFSEELMSICNDHLLFLKTMKDERYVVRNIDLRNNEYEDIVLPAEVLRLYSIICDDTGKIYYLYYQGADSEINHIGRFENDSDEVDELSELSRKKGEREWIYDYKMIFNDNCLYWIRENQDSKLLSELPYRHLFECLDLGTGKKYIFEEGYEFEIVDDKIYCLVMDEDWYCVLYLLKKE